MSGSGWGQGTGTPAGHRQGDLGVGVHPPRALPVEHSTSGPVMSTSQLITQRSIERAAAKDLAVAVRRFLANGSTENRSALQRALAAFDKAHGP